MSEKEYVGKSAYQGDIASRYDEQRITEPIWAQEQAFVGQWVQTLPPHATVLDIPAGTGRFVAFFLDRGLKVHARDISADMLGEIRRRFDPLPPGVDVEVGDAERLALPDNSVDHVISWRFLHLVPPPVVGRVLAEFQRVCRGTIVLQVFGVRPADARLTAWGALKDRLRPWWRRLRPVDRTIAATPWAHITSYPHPEENLLRAFAAAGLVVVETHTLELHEGLANRVYFLTRTPAQPSRP